jgi:hypothetical protein
VSIVLFRNSPNDKIPYAQVFRVHKQEFTVNKMSINTWFHIAVVFDGQYLMLYVNGVLEANSGAPLGVIRNSCYIDKNN